MSASGSAPAPCHSFNLEERCVAAGYDNGDIKLLDLRTNAVIRRAGPAQSHALLRRGASVERASSHVCLSAHCPRGSTDRDAHTLHCGPAPAQLKWSAARFLTHPCCETHATVSGPVSLLAGSTHSLNRQLSSPTAEPTGARARVHMRGSGIASAECCSARARVYVYVCRCGGRRMCRTAFAPSSSTGKISR